MVIMRDLKRRTNKMKIKKDIYIHTPIQMFVVMIIISMIIKCSRLFLSESLFFFAYYCHFHFLAVVVVSCHARV